MSKSPMDCTTKSAIRRVALAIICRNGRFAVIRRRSRDVLNGLWEFPGGGIHASESPAHAAEREALEETGLHVRALRVLPAVTHVYPHGAVELHPVLCELVEEGERDQADPRAAAGDSATELVAGEDSAEAGASTVRTAAAHVSKQVRWVTRQELAALDMPPANAEIVRQFADQSQTAE